MNPESLVPYAALAIMGFLVCSRISGRRLSLTFRRPTRWDIAAIAFAVYLPVVGAVIHDGFIASIVVVLTGLAIIVAGRRFGQGRVASAP